MNKDPLWQKAIDQEMTSLVEEKGFHPFAWVRGLLRKVLHPRRHPRHDIDFMSTLTVTIAAEGFPEKDAAPTDIGLGGMGVSLPVPYLPSFHIGQKVELKITFGDKIPLPVEGTVRFLLAQGARGTLGLEFTKPSAELIDHILELTSK